MIGPLLRPRVFSAYPVMLLYLGLAIASHPANSLSTADNPLQFDDAPLESPIDYPDWFKIGFLELKEDLAQAVAQGKQGLIVYFGQEHCAYSERLMEVNFQTPDIVEYTRRYFDVVPVDIWSPETLTTPDGAVLSQRDYALALDTNFTPSLVFYDATGQVVLQLRGYYPPYLFRAALEYVADGHYAREAFRAYIARGDPTLRFEPGDLIDEPFFVPPPHNLDRRHLVSEQPLAVFFEQGNCHACDILHTQPLQRPEVRALLDKIESVQLDMWSDAPVIKPNGQPSTAHQWAADLGIFYAPTIVFFDERGREVIRVDSVVRQFRLRRVLDYVVNRGYRKTPGFLGPVHTTRGAALLPQNVLGKARGERFSEPK